MVIGMLFYSIGDFSKSFKYARKALFLNSACFLVGAPVHSLLADMKYDMTFSFIDSLKNFIPCEVACHIMKVHTFTVLKEFDSAGVYLAKFYKPGDIMRDLYINYLLIETGRRDESMVSLQNRISYQQQEAGRGRLPWPSQHFEILAAAYALTGEKQKCLESLRELEKRGCSDVPAGYFIFPGFDYLRNDPEFKAIIKRIEENKAAIREEIRKMERRGEIKL